MALTFAFARFKRWLLQPYVLLIMIAFGIMIMGFQEVAEEMMEGDTHAIDTSILMLMRDGNDPGNPWGPHWLEEMVRDISALGGIAVLTLVSLCAVLYLVTLKKYGRAAYLAATIVTGTLMSNFLKAGFDRPRPDFIPHDITVFTASFPSGHSMMAALVYLTLGALLAEVQKDTRVKAYLMGVAVLIAVMVGVSRLYLGVHWPSDVLAGWIAGAFWALLFWTIEKLAAKRRRQG